MIESPPGTFVRIALSAALLAIGTTALHLAPSPSPAYKMVDEVVRDRDELEGRRLRVHGWVQAGTIQRVTPTITAFVLGRGGERMSVWYEGILPDTFKDQSELVVDGALDGERFVADRLLAKCATKYEADVDRNLTTVFK